jgi:hypothetical protein
VCRAHHDEVRHILFALAVLSPKLKKSD